MQLRQIDITKSPDTVGAVRLVGEVAYGKGHPKVEHHWIEVPEAYGEHLSTSGNPWLVWLSLHAFSRGEPLLIDRPVDAVLLENIREVMRIWQRWYPRFHPVPIETSTYDSQTQPARAKRGTFFSLGVDTFFTVFHHDAQSAARAEPLIDDLLLLWGFDIIREDADAFGKLRARSQTVASELGKELIVVTTNLRETQLNVGGPLDLTQDPFLATIALALETRYREVLISAGWAPASPLQPHHTHPVVNALLTTGPTRVTFFGTEFSRITKTALEAQSDLAMRTLHVCWYPPLGENCGRCNKCLRTMATLEVLGVLDQCTAFPKGSLTLEKLAKAYVETSYDLGYLRQIQAFAREHGRGDIESAIEHSIRRSERINKLLWLPNAFGRWLRNRPVLWQLIGRPLRRIRKTFSSTPPGVRH